MFDLYAVAVGNIERLTGCGKEAERLCEERFAAGFRKRYRCQSGKVQDLTAKERAVGQLAAITTVEGDGCSMKYASRTKRAYRIKKKLGINVKLKYGRPEAETSQTQIRRQLRRL
jgi:hypothetical protein